MRCPDDNDAKGMSRRALLSGLAAGSLAVGCGYDPTSWFARQRFDVDRRFSESIDVLSHPAPPRLARGDSWSMLAVSDVHSMGEVPTTLDEVRRYIDASPVDLVFCLGDIADSGYPRELDAVREGLDRLGVPVFTALGNHDTYNEGWAHFRDVFGASAYEIDVAGSTLIVLDSAGSTLGGLQRPWLEERLGAARARAEHLFVLTHYPLWSSRFPMGDMMGSQQEVYDILDLLRRFEVEAHVSGHTHRWGHTTVDGVELYTVSSIREAAIDRTALRIDVGQGFVQYERVDLG